MRAGIEPTGEVLVSGVLTWDEFKARRATWDKVRQCIGLDAEFYEGAELLLFPPEVLNFAEQLARELSGMSGRRAKAIGCDPAEGGDKSAWAVIDELGLIKLVVMQTPDTTVVTGTTLALMREWDVPPERVCFDRGGGGKEHADRLRLQGFDVRTVAFGESLTPEPQRHMRQFPQKKDEREERYEYVNRRAEMYHRLSLMMELKADGTPVSAGFAIPAEYAELRRQLSVMPKLTDPEGRYRMLPKNKRRHGRPELTDAEDEDTLTGLLGCSPDEADALVVAVFAMTNRPARATAGVFA